MLTSEERRELMDQIRRLPEQLEALLAEAPAEALYAHPLPGEWSVAQNIHHLADAHMNSFIRLKLILTEDEPILKPFDQERWAQTADAQAAPVADSLRLLQGLHARWVALLERLDETQWQRRGLHPEVGYLTPEDLLRSYAAHGQAHLDQIARLLAASGQAGQDGGALEE